MLADRPNILLICSDSHRFDYVGYAGADWLRTPHLDALAARGAVFTQCTTNCPTCIPARTALCAGLAPHRFGAGSNESTALPWPAWTFYQHLRDAGYWTACTGKFHINTDRFTTPSRTGPAGRLPGHYALGFCDPFGLGQPMKPSDPDRHPYARYLHDRGLLDRYNDDRNRRRNWTQPRRLIENAADSVLDFEDRVDAFTTRQAIERMAAFPADRPWFHQVNLSSPHPPSDPAPVFAEQYRDATPPPPRRDLTGKPNWLHAIADEQPLDDVVFSQRQYSAHVAELDELVGRLVEAVEAMGVADRTLIVYTSDHGEMLGDFHRYHKNMPWEPSIRVPLIVAGPGVAAGRSDAIVEWIDLNPTLLQLAQTHDHPPLDARSFAPVLRGEAREHRQDALITHDHFHCLRGERYKLIVNHNDLEELYDLHADPGEEHNLLASEGGDDGSIAQPMRRRLRERIRHAGRAR